MDTMTPDLAAPVETTEDGWAIIARDYDPEDPSDIGGDWQMDDGASTRLTFLSPDSGAVVEVTIYAYPTAYFPTIGQVAKNDLKDFDPEYVRWSADATLCWERWDSLADYVTASLAGSHEGSKNDVTYDEDAGGPTWSQDLDEARERARGCARDYALNAALYLCPGTL